MSDSNWANVSSLLHFNGANNSTTFTDETGRTWTGSGNAKISTAQAALGVSSLALDGSGDWIETASNAAFNMAGDFTIEGRIRLNALANNYQTIISSGNTSFASGAYFLLVYGQSAPVEAQRGKIGFGSFASNPLVISTTVLVTDWWYPFAVSRVGNAVKLSVNGVVEATAFSTEAFDFSNTKTLIGANGWDGAASHFNGYIDELRVTKGVGRRQENYVVDKFEFDAGTSRLLSGTVLDSAGSPIARTVRAFRRSDGAMTDETTSSAVDGSFSLRAADATDHFVVVHDDSKNALIFDRITPP